MADWERISAKVEEKMRGWEWEGGIGDEEDFESAAEWLTKCLSTTIEEEVELTKPLPDEKRWWTRELEELKKAKNRLASKAFKMRAWVDAEVHQRAKRAARRFAEEVLRAKRERWEEWLNEASTRDLWTANGYLKSPVGDGGRTRIPTLRVYNDFDEEIEVTDNGEKAKVLARTFFPPPPNWDRDDEQEGRRRREYPDPLPDPEELTEATVERHIKKMLPYKACGPDGIPNVAKTRLKFDDYLSHEIPINNGIGQGDPMSMILYIIYNASLLEIVDREEGEDVIGFVDDIAMVAEGEDTEEAVEKLWLLMNQEGGGMSWSEGHNSRFEVSKSVVMHLTRGREREEWNEETGEGILVLEMGGEVVKRVRSFKYLGVQVDDQLNWKAQAAKVQEKATKWTLQFKRLSKPATGINLRLMRQLYNATVVPKVTYAIDVWYTPPTKPTNGKKNTGSVGIMKKLTRIQRMATLTITGAPRTTPTEVLDAHAGVLPLDLRLLQICHRNLTRLVSLPQSHPLNEIIAREVEKPPKRHPTQIYRLTKIFDIDPRLVEKVEIAPRRPRGLSKTVKVTKRKSGEKAKQEEKRDAAEVRVYTDGGGKEKWVAAAVAYHRGEKEECAREGYVLGRASRHTVLEAELTGILLAMHMLAGAEMEEGNTASIYTDSQEAIQRIRDRSRKTGQKLVEAIYHTARGIKGVVKIRWVPAHDGVAGNERADRLVKEIEEGKTEPSIWEDLPTYLQHETPINADAEKESYKKELERMWNERWGRKEKRRRGDCMEEEVPLKEFHKAAKGLTRAQTSMIIQARSDHLPLNARLFMINKSNTSKCPRCTELRGGMRAEENVQHVVYECKGHRRIRRELWKAVGKINASIREMTANTEHAKALADFLIGTGRMGKKWEERDMQDKRREEEGQRALETIEEE
ncbi:hypothetical protein CVT24_012427 [Panaeolus cyanescens]|uniref:RNase H type-1 domain-containing protein n=1 Tax=Panaeolus cyanescens TaxID=181874 RepID=A0A409WUE7_9AGAR|nr:hypothetical protein CVT24_012427 [Panaeolus cyanescens]